MGTERMILGRNAFFSTDPSVTGLNNNVVVCGGSGCGKTMSIQEPSLLEASKTSRVVPVAKRRIVDQYENSLKERGYDVQIMDFVNPGASTCGWNLLRNVKNYTDIRALAEAIVMANPRKEHSHADTYWDDGSTSTLGALIFLTLWLNKRATFNDVLTCFDKLRIKEGYGSSVETNLDSQFEELEKADPTSYALVCWKSFKDVPYKTAACIYSTLSVCLTTLFTPDVRKIMAKKKQIGAKELTERKTVLFVITSPVNPVLRLLINIFHMQMIRDLFEYAESMPDGKLPIPVRYEFDDFACGGKILNFPEYISIFREKEISVVLLIQSESQLISMYGNDATTILNNCDTFLYMGGMDLQTCRSVSERLNVPLDEVLYMPIGQEVIFRRGQRPIVTQRYDILSDERYLRIQAEYERRSRTAEKR